MIILYKNAQNTSKKLGDNSIHELSFVTKRNVSTDISWAFLGRPVHTLKPAGAIWSKFARKIGKLIEDRTKQEMANKTESRTILEDKWKREIQECDSDTIKDVIKIRLHMWQMSCNYKRIILPPNVHYVKNQKTLQSMCWNVKKLKSSHLVKKTVRENGKR